MSETIESLLCDLLTWIGIQERPYAEVMEAWRTSCPRLPVWEEANDRGFVTHTRRNGQAIIALTKAGRAFLEARYASRAATSLHLPFTNEAATRAEPA